MRFKLSRYRKRPISFLAYAVLLMLIFTSIKLYFKCTSITFRATKSKPFLDCFNMKNEFKIQQRGHYWVLTNYITAKRWVACHESITITTIGDPSQLDNLITLVERWNGPISVALYTPGSDMESALRIIRHLRTCYSLIAEFVSFHFFFEAEFRPPVIPPKDTVQQIIADSELCTTYTIWQLMNGTIITYRRKQQLRFPINVARNIARDAATTHYIFASDIELYPSVNFIPDFLDMLRQNYLYFQATTPCVFVLPVFELKQNASVPATKTDLLSLIDRGVADVFHREYCEVCHTIPGYRAWLQANEKHGLRVIYSTKRTKRGKWEPFYVGTNQEPYFDERLDWEGRCNKAIQGYSMCVLNYNYHILDNAFLVHKFRVKLSHETGFSRKSFAVWTLPRIRQEIEPDIHAFHGTNEDCAKIQTC